MATKKAQDNSVVVKIPAANIQQVTLTLQGVGAGLLVQRFGESKSGIAESKALGEAQPLKAVRDYDAEFEEARYIENGKDVFPAAAIKRTIVEGCSFVDGVFMKTARGAFFIMSDFIEIESEPPTMDKRWVKIGNGRSKTIQMRIRPLYRNWTMRVPIRYDAAALPLDRLVHLFVQAGFSIGIGEYRPQCNGSFGMFEVAGTSNGHN